jgi:hypothetical protein
MRGVWADARRYRPPRRQICYVAQWACWAERREACCPLPRLLHCVSMHAQEQCGVQQICCAHMRHDVPHFPGAMITVVSLLVVSVIGSSDVLRAKPGSVCVEWCSEEYLGRKGRERCDAWAGDSAEQCLARFRPTQERPWLSHAAQPGAFTQMFTLVYLYVSFPSILSSCEILCHHVHLTYAMFRPDKSRHVPRLSTALRAELRFRVSKSKLCVLFTICPRHSALPE